MEVSKPSQPKGVLVAHANARLTVHGRALLVERVLAGHRPADVAHQMGCSRATAYKWLRRYRAEGAGGPGRPPEPAAPLPAPHPGRARARGSSRPAGVHRRGADWIGAELGMAPSTVGRVLARHRLPRLPDLDALTGEPVRRGPMSRRALRARAAGRADPHRRQEARADPRGRRLARPRARPQARAARRAQGFDYVHSAIDDHSRLAYSEIHPDERGDTCAGLPRPRGRLLRLPRHHPHRAGDERQRLQLPTLGRLPGRAGAAWVPATS